MGRRPCRENQRYHWHIGRNTGQTEWFATALDRQGSARIRPPLKRRQAPTFHRDEILYRRRLKCARVHPLAVEIHESGGEQWRASTAKPVARKSRRSCMK